MNTHSGAVRLIWLLACACGLPAYAYSPIYQYTVVAAEGMTTSDGFTLGGIESEVSINEQARLAFTARIGNGDQLVVGRTQADLRNLSRSPDGRNFSYPQINDRDLVVTRELSAGQGVIRVWDTHNPGSFSNVVSTTLSPFSQVTCPTIANGTRGGSPWLVGYLGRLYDLDFAYYANTSGIRDDYEILSPLAGAPLSRFRAMSASAPELTFVAQFTDVATAVSRIAVFIEDTTWTSIPIATTGDGEWEELCNTPGISDSGQVVAFIGKKRDADPALYLALGRPTFLQGVTILKIMGLNDMIAYDGNAAPIPFTAFNMLDRVAVLHQTYNPAGWDGDTLIIAFKATPARPSRTNPIIGSGTPFLFNDQEAVWTLRVDLEGELAGSTVQPHAYSPVPVVQIGDEIGGSVVEDTVLYDPLSTAAVNLDLHPYTANKGDHFVGLSIRTASGIKVVRAARIDDDEDGLMDHWETEGVDVDGDGNVELDLPALGANPQHKDIFLEVDWTADRVRGGARPWTNRFPPYTAQGMAEMFRLAPVGNPDGTNGITLHVDAGPGSWFAEDPTSSSSSFGYMTRIPYSVNLPDDSALLGGGDTVCPADDPTNRLDMVYFGPPKDFTIPGLHMRALHDVKNQYFGNKDKWAREFAFKYTVLADSQILVLTEGGSPFVAGAAGATSNTLSSAGTLPPSAGWLDSVLITEGRGAGQIRRIESVNSGTLTLLDAWETIPDISSRFTLLDTSISGMGEVYFFPSPDYHALPGNDFILSMSRYAVNDGGWLADYAAFWRTLNHEMGHCFGLRHGGNNHVNKKANYHSIMNYLYLRNGYSDYSVATDAVFNDWAYLKHNASLNYVTFGNSYNEFSQDNPPDDPDFVIDLRKPSVTVIAPLAGTNFAVGADVNISILATDDVAVDQVFAVFDLDGDGQIEDTPPERMTATPVGGNVYAATFPGVSGPFTTRGVQGLAFDTSGNIGASVVAVTAGDPAGAGRLIHSTNGVFTSQTTGGVRRIFTTFPITVPGTGRLTFTVSGTPPVRSTTNTQTRYDSSVTQITFGGRTNALTPACNPPGRDPSVCSSYWQSPGNGPLIASVAGPAIYDTNGVFQGHPQQSFALKVTFEPVDITAPQVQITQPPAGSFAEVSHALPVAVMATDDYTVTAVRVSFDVNGNGNEADAGEVVNAVLTGSPPYRVTFAPLTGEADIRTIRAVATDGAGHESIALTRVEVRIPDTEPPAVAFRAPVPGWPLKSGDDLRVELQAGDNVELVSVTASFDLNGDTDTADAGESLVANWAAPNVYTAVFHNVTGSNGARTVHALATDTSGNAGLAEVPVAIGGVIPATQTVFTASGTIPAQPAQWSGGQQQVVDFSPIQIPDSGTLAFIVTGSPSVRQLGQNITRSDAYVRNVTFNSVAYNLYSSLQANSWTSSVSICTTRLAVASGGTLDFAILGPGQWNTWGEFIGTPAQDYTLRIVFASVDATRPVITFLAPTLGQNLPLGTGVVVQVAATDNVAMASVVVSMDVNGDLDTDDYQESIGAVTVSSGVYRAQFGTLAGGPETRTIAVKAMDTSFNITDKSISVGVGGVGAGESVLYSCQTNIAAQPIDISGGTRQVLPFGPIQVAGQGRMTFRVTATPSIRKLGLNLQRYDPMVTRIFFNGSPVTLTPVCNGWDQDPAVCVSTWDTPGPGNLTVEVLGGGTWNIWGEFQGHYAQSCLLEVLMLPGPRVTSVTPTNGWIGADEPVMVRGSGFAQHCVVLFGEVPATEVVRVCDTQLTCRTPPGIARAVDVRVLNPDLQKQPWNYGEPYGLFGTLTNGLTYQVSGATNRGAERLLGTWAGYFPAVGEDGDQQATNVSVAIPGAGRLRCQSYAFVPILNPVPGPYNNREDLTWCNESTAVRKFVTAGATTYYPVVESTDLDYAYGPVVSTAIQVVPGSASGSAQVTIRGPARWNAFWRDFGDYVMASAPAQNWSLAVWFADQPVLSQVSPAWGGSQGGTTVTLRGQNFAEGTRVFFGDRESTNVTIVSNSLLTCKSPAGLSAPVDIRVVLLGMTSTLPAAFTYEPEVITQFTYRPGSPPATVDIRSEPGKSYQLQYNLSLLSPTAWTNAGLSVSGNGSTMRLSDPAPPTQSKAVFYRVIITSTP